MRLLIERGSDVNTMDASGRTTIQHAVDSHSEAALQLVLDAGADPNPPMLGSLRRSSPLTSASFGGLKTMARMLLHSGARVDTCNPEGRTAIHTAISYNKYDILQLFAEESLGDVNCGASQLLAVVARHADEQTMSILASSRHLLNMLGVSHDDPNRKAMEDRNGGEKLEIAFEQLLTARDDIQSRQICPAHGGFQHSFNQQGLWDASEDAGFE
ncbi:ankyrin repeat containing protein [Colletotrichum chrysophilum]|uniref:Ankyrin repeat containing protein n=1 Tax=Colletotrichum chrysophilum TaxID=1836956 RepID=A0AAD9A224_9PEZI|nr:ankyrin repeat containing protein [Colletotrichum chrysophilum]